MIRSRRNIIFFLAAVIVCTVFLAALTFFAIAEEIPEGSQIALTDADGYTTYHTAYEFTRQATSPFFSDKQGTPYTRPEPYTVDFLTDVTYSGNYDSAPSATDGNLWFYGDVTINGNGHTFTYTGTDYAICVTNKLNDNAWMADAPAEMKTARVINLNLTAPNKGGFKFYNSVLELGEVNNMSAAGDMLVLSARSHGKLIISGGTYRNGGQSPIISIGGDKTSNSTSYYSTVSLEITGGEFISSGGNGRIVTMAGSANDPSKTSLKISGGTFTSDKNEMISAGNTSVTIDGGTFNGAATVTINSTCTASIKGGTFGTGVAISDPGLKTVFTVNSSSSFGNDFSVTKDGGITTTFHNISEFANAASNPTAGNGDNLTRVELLRNVPATNTTQIWLFGDVLLDGNKMEYCYNGSDYAICTTNAVGTNGFTNEYFEKGTGHFYDGMKTATIENLNLSCERSGGGFKFYNSIISLGDGNNFRTIGQMLITPRSAGKVVITGGTYTSLGGNAILSIGRSTETADGGVFNSTVGLEITGGEFNCRDGGKAVHIYGSPNVPENAQMSIAGGTFTAGADHAIDIRDSYLTISGGTFYAPINLSKETAFVTVTGGSFPNSSFVGYISGSNFVNSAGVATSNGIVAEIYIGETLKYQYTLSEFIKAFSLADTGAGNNVFKTDATLKGNNLEVRLLTDIETFDYQLCIYTYENCEIVFNGENNTITALTGSNPVMRVHSEPPDKGGTVTFNDLNIVNNGASCLQFYDGTIVNLNNCNFSAPNHYAVFPTDYGTLNINAGTTLSGRSALNFSIQNTTSGKISEINVNNGATLTGTETVINFWTGSKSAELNLNDGATVTATPPSKNLITFAADSQTAASANNTINVNGAELTGSIKDNSESNAASNVINLNSGSLTTYDKISSVYMNTESINDGFDITSYSTGADFIITLPSEILLTGGAARLEISARVWISEGERVDVAVTSQNGFKLNCVGADDVVGLGYELKNGDTVIANNGVATSFEPSTDQVEKQLDIRLTAADIKYAGEYRDTLTFTVSVNTAS